MDYKEGIIEQIKEIDTTKLSFKTNEKVKSTIIEEQKVYFWIRLYLHDEDINIKEGDEIVIEWRETSEKLKTIFTAFGKKGFDKDKEKSIINYSKEDDKKVLCLMVDEKMINSDSSKEIPFIRTLFKIGNYYEYQLYKREYLTFTNSRNGIILDYFDADF